MSEFQTMDTGNEVAPWIKSGAFNNYYTYSFISKSSFYAMISPTYYDFYSRIVRNWLWWYDGWVPYFHNADNGIPSTRIAQSIVDKVAKKVTGGRIMFKNAGNDGHRYQLCPALGFVSGDWAQKSNFEETVKKAILYACAGGTSLLKLNKDGKGLWAEAVRLDSFLPSVNSRGEVTDVKCFLYPFTNVGVRSGAAQTVSCYYIVEHRYFGRYTRANGEVMENAPLVEYTILTQNGSVTNGEYLRQDKGGAILYQNLPPQVRREIGKSYPSIRFNSPVLLPFADSLGCEIVRWSVGVPGIPSVPFGESALNNIISYLMDWDYYAAAFCTDMYTGRGRVILPKYMTGTKSANQNSGLDHFIYEKVETANPDDQKPVPIQFELRSGDWREIRNMLIQNMAVNIGINISTLASFLTDNTARTAREVSTEENETAGFVDEKRSLLEKPINRILKLVTQYYGYNDEVVVRWSSAGLTNRATLAEIISQGLQTGFLSRYKAVQMFNYDDDDRQVQEEYERVSGESKNRYDDIMIGANGNEGTESCDVNPQNDSIKRGAK